jgi:tetratricopeptide (TPR) repeat protein
LKEYQQAIADYTRAIELDPKDALVYSNRGNAYHDLEEYHRAIEDYTRAIELDPKDALAYYNRGNAYCYLKEHHRAIEDYTRVIELDPKNAFAHDNLGFAYLWLGNTQEAKNAYRRGWEVDKTYINILWMIEWVEMGRERIGRDMAVRLEEIAATNSKDYVAYVCRGVALGLRQKLKEGIAELEQAISLMPETWDAYFWKGMICVYLGRDSMAMEAFEKALAVNLPPLLLTPLYWLEKDKPKFFNEYAAPLLARYNV